MATNPSQHWQFSIKHALVLTGFAAFYMGLGFGLPDMLAVYVLAVWICLLTTMLIVVACFGNNDLRAFALGVLAIHIPMLMYWWFGEYGEFREWFGVLIGNTLDSQESASFRSQAVYFGAFALGNGIVAVCLRRVLLSSKLHR